MNAGYQKAQALDGDANLPANQKTQMWQDFLQSYTDDNPYSQQDDDQRGNARNRRQYWSSYHSPEPTIPKIKQDEAKPQAGRFSLRSNPTALSSEAVTSMLRAKGFYEEELNKTGKGIPHDYERRAIAGDQVVIDHVTGLMWQQSGSLEEMTYEKAKQWIVALNRSGYAGYHDWRLPTLEEAMSLLEPVKKGASHINPVFDKSQSSILTSDLVAGYSRAWKVPFHYVSLDYAGFFPNGFVRAVRSGQSFER